jgi:hypothetical protein
LNIGAAADWRVLKAAAAGALIGTAVTVTVFVIDQKQHPSGGPLDFGAPSFVMVVAVVAMAVGTLLSALCLGGVVLVFGAERLSNWPALPAILIGGAAGAAIIWLIFGLLWNEWSDLTYILIGGLYGACAAFFWTRWARS